MKKTRKIIPALAMLLVSAVMMSTASFAWFSTNTVVEATGMKVKATADDSLVISVSPDMAGFKESVTFDTGATAVKPMTYLDASSAPEGVAGYYVVTNGSSIDYDTGLLKDPSGSYTYAAATTTNYIDKVVYLATSGTAALTAQDLVANVTFADGLTGGQQAITIDFAVIKMTDKNVVTYTDAAFTTRYSVNTTSANKSIEIASNIELPVIGDAATGYVAVVMRIYLDGALTGTDGKAFVTSANGDIADAGVSVSFSVAATA